jgi:hypothetical protein
MTSHLACQASEKRPCLPVGRHLLRFLKYASGRLTNSLAWQEVAPYSSRRHSQDLGGSRKRDFAKLNLHLPACAKPLRRRQGHF